MRFLTLLFSFALLTFILLAGCSPIGDEGIELVYEPVDSNGTDGERTVIESVEELDEIVAHMSGNFFMSARVQMRNISVWEQLGDFYTANQHILVLRGISGMSIEYSFVGEVVEAEIFPQYEMFMNVIIAYERSNTAILTAEERRVYDKAQKIVQEHRTATTWGTAHALHTYLKDTVEYDHDYAENDNAFNVYGALLEGRAVCQGYAQSYKVLLHMAGIDNLLVTGKAGGEYHAWNLVNYGTASMPQWYHVDVTWNDREDGRSNRYFNVSDMVLGASHSWSSFEHFPAANSMRMNYFRYSGKNAASLQELEGLFVAAFHRGQRFIEFLCTFSITQDDLVFLWNYVDGIINFSIDSYGYDQLLTIILPQ
jgi:hypothetical protein